MVSIPSRLAFEVDDVSDDNSEWLGAVSLKIELRTGCSLVRIVASITMIPLSLNFEVDVLR